MSGCQVFDFDGTVYKGDSSIDFFLFAIKKYPACIMIIPRFICYSILYILKKCTKEQVKQEYFSFLKNIPDVSHTVDLFWKTHSKKLYEWYIQRDHSKDVVISASPEFLLRPVLEIHGVQTIIATQVEPCSGRFIGKNCYGEEKVQRLQKKLGNIEIDEFYSDSKSDLPLAKLAKKAYFVKKGKIAKWRIEKR